MKLYRSELDNGIHKKLFDIDANQFSSDEFIFYDKYISGEISIEKFSNGYHARGMLKIPFEFTCDRCLTNFQELKNTKFNVLLTNNPEIYQNDTNDVILIENDQDEIDLKSLFQELIFLEKRMKIICNEDCKGLCSNCGINLNTEKCNCLSKDNDNPWEVLKNLKGK